MIEVIEVVRIERDHWGPGAHSPNHEIAQSLSAAAAAAPGSVGEIADSHEHETFHRCAVKSTAALQDGPNMNVA